MPIKKRILKNKNKNTFYKKKRMMKGGKDMNQYEEYQENYQEEDNFRPKHGGLSELLGMASEIFKSGAGLVFDKATKMFNLDMSQLNQQFSPSNVKELLQDNLNKLNAVLNNPETKQQIIEFIKVLGEQGNVLIEALTPSIKKALTKLTEIMNDAGPKLARSMINFLISLIESVPGLGTAVGWTIAVDNLVRAVQSTISAVLEGYTVNVDSITETIRRYKDMFSKQTSSNQEQQQQPQQQQPQQQQPPPENNEEPSNYNQLGGRSASVIKKRITNSIANFHKTNKIRRRVKKQTRKNKKRQRK